MHDFIHRHRKMVQIVLAVMFLPFIFFGVDSYFRGGGGSDTVATVSGQNITQQEFTQALQERQNALRRLIGDRIDPAMLDSPELRFAVVENLVRQRVLVDQALRHRVLVSDQQLREIIADQPVFRDGDKFSHERYLDLLKRQNMSEVAFENGLRRDLMVQRVSDAINGTSIVPVTVAERLLRLNTQQREVSQFVFDPDKFAPQAKVDETAIKQYYDGRQDEFRIAEQARLEYLVLSLDDVASQVAVSAEDVKQYFDQNITRYTKGEERRANHILITIEGNADAAAKAAARAKAEQLSKQARQNPASFGELARKNSQDPGSASKGGDLGFFPRGAMIKPFDDAVFAMKEGEISAPVESQYGYHVIQLMEVRGRGFEDFRKDVERDLKRQNSGKRFSVLGEQMRDLAFEQGDSLKPAAAALKLQVQTSGWVSRTGGDNKLFSNPKLLAAVFSEEVLRNKRNSEVVDVGDNTLVVARILEHRPAAVRPMEEVKAEIQTRLVRQQASQLAAKQGREELARLKQDGVAATAIAWDTGKLVSRGNATGVSPAALVEVFRADVAKLPAYAGVEREGGGYTLLRISRVVDEPTVDIAKRKGTSDELRRLLGQEELNALIASLKQRADVKIQQDKLERKDR